MQTQDARTKHLRGKMTTGLGGQIRCRPSTSYPQEPHEAGSLLSSAMSLGSMIARNTPGLLSTAANLFATGATSPLGQKVLSKAATTGIDYLSGQQKKQQAAELKEAELRLQAELERQRLGQERDLQRESAYEQAEFEAAQRETLRREQEKTIAEREQRMASLARSEASTTQYQQQAGAYLRLLKSRYPNVFALRPELERYAEGQLLGALLSPADPSDPMYVQKALGELEFQLARAQQQLTMQGFPEYVPTPTTVQKKYPEAPSWSKPKAKKKGKGHTTARLGYEAAPPKSAGFGGGVSAVLTP